MNMNEGKGKMKWIVLLIFILVVGAGWIMSKKPVQKAEENLVMEEKMEPVSDTIEATDAGTMANDVTLVQDEQMQKSAEMEAGAFYYKPDTLTAQVGKPVKFTLKSVDMMHDFNIDELGVKSPIVKAGESYVIEFTPTKAGTFEFYCSVGQHRSKGQIGKITVTN